MEIDYKYTICVLSITFNQAQYIEEALNGFCIQQTNFPFVCVVVDDASTDGEQKVIAKYLEQHFNLDDDATIRIEETDDYKMVFACHRENKNCFFAVYYLKYNHHSIKKTKEPYFSAWRNDAKYVAECEGDDYWTDWKKLQRQFDFMETHPESSLCFHSHNELFPNGNLIESKPKRIKESYTPQDVILVGGGFMATNSMFYRCDYVKNEEKPDFWKNCPIGDLPIMLYLINKGSFGYIDKPMSVHRAGAIGSWTSSQNDYVKKSRHYKAILKMYDEYDVYTGYKYHSAIRRKKNANRVKHLKTFLRFWMGKFVKR